MGTEAIERVRNERDGISAPCWTAYPRCSESRIVVLRETQTRGSLRFA